MCWNHVCETEFCEKHRSSLRTRFRFMNSYTYGSRRWRCKPWRRRFFIFARLHSPSTLFVCVPVAESTKLWLWFKNKDIEKSFVFSRPSLHAGETIKASQFLKFLSHWLKSYHYDINILLQWKLFQRDQTHIERTGLRISS